MADIDAEVVSSGVIESVLERVTEPIVIVVERENERD